MAMSSTLLIPFSNFLMSKIADKGFEYIYNKLIKTDELNIKFNNAVGKVSKKLQDKYPAVLGGSIIIFFKEEIILNELIKLIFRHSVMDIDVISSRFDIGTLPENFILEFIENLKEELFNDREFDELLSNKELYILFHCMDSNIEQIAKKSELTVGEINSIKQLLEQRLGPIFSVSEFVKNYTESALRNLSQINFIGLGVDISVKRERKNIGDVFVHPNFKLLNVNFKGKKRILLEENKLDIEFHDINIVSYDDLFTHSDRIVVLGNPGSGKSILIKSIICNILNKESLFNDKEIINFLPFRIELRKYISFKKQYRGNILKYFTSLIEEEYGISNISESIIEQVIKEYKCVFFFDGLDEIFKIQDKIEIRNDIENFHIIYPNVRSLTTSRIIGYDEAKLNPDEFCELNILNFDESQIREYISKWYEKEEEDEIIRVKEINDFIDKKDVIDVELISNPLLLSLIVILYRNVLKLPESKLEIYQSCTKTLVDKWDAIKALDIDLDVNIYKNKEKIFADLAYWQYEQLSGDVVNVTYEKALKTVSNTLEKKLKLSDEFNSKDQAQNFMEYAQKRSIYFDNNFTHKTFLEYYTAYWIFSNIEKKNNTDGRNDLILKYIGNSFWHIVIELLLNMIDNDQADNEIIDGIFEKFLSKPEAIPFALSTVYSFKNISLEYYSKVIDSAMRIIIIDYSSLENDFSRDNLQSKIYDALTYLYSSNEKSKNLIDEIALKILNENPDKAKLVYSFYYELDFFGTNNIEDSKIINYPNFSSFIENDEYLYICNTFYMSRKSKDISYFSLVQKFVDKFGVDNLFNTYSAIFNTFRLGEFFYYYVYRQLNIENIHALPQNMSWLLSKGINVDKMFESIKSRDIFLRKKDSVELVKKIMEMYEFETDKLLEKIYLILIFHTAIGREDLTVIELFAKTSKKREVLNNILKLNTKKRMDFIINLNVK